jgi:hypothetical protein
MSKRNGLKATSRKPVAMKRKLRIAGKQLEFDFTAAATRGVFTPKVIATGVTMLVKGTTRQELQRRLKANDKRVRRFVDRVAIGRLGLKVTQERDGMDTKYTVTGARKRRAA